MFWFKISCGYVFHDKKILSQKERIFNLIQIKNPFFYLGVISQPLLLFGDTIDCINVNEKYLDYLRAFEGRIPRTDYGPDRYKPFFGILFEDEKFYYITQVSHAQDRHKRMKNQPDFGSK